MMGISPDRIQREEYKAQEISLGIKSQLECF